MKQFAFNRRMLLKSATATAAVGVAGSFGLSGAQAAGPLKLWTIGIAKVGAKDWSAMSAQAGIEIHYNAKSCRHARLGGPG